MLAFFFALFALQIQLGPETLDVEIAKTMAEKRKGLGGRGELAEGKGMLFLYDFPQICSFWMKDTKIPLVVGFFDANQRLIGWEEMEVPPPNAYQLPTYSSKKPVLYALEVPAGWFDRHKIRVGEKFAFLDQLDSIK